MQGAGFFTFGVGGAQVSVVSDGAFVMQPAQVFPEVPKRELEEAAKAAHLSPDAYPGQVNVLLVRRGNDVILIDTGCGRGYSPTTGFLLPNLARAGVRPSDVTHVILTHAHPDHVGGLRDEQGRPTFGRAKVYVNRDEHDFWTSPDPRMPGTLAPASMQAQVIKIATAAFAGIRESLELVKPDDTIAGLVKVIDARGHTPGHIALRIGTTAGDSVLHLGDALFVPPLQLKHPEWHALFDADPVLAATARRRLFDLVAEEQMLVCPAHAPFPAVGYIDREADAYRWTPKVWQWDAQ
jgi:glyoxylase-like metal-dependent hydrolase (beta-lactamase superfamily II)